MSDQDQARDLFFRGLACLENRELKNAELVFAETLKLAPRSVPTLNNLAIAQYEQRKIAEAEQIVMRFLEINKKNIDAHMILSTFEKDQQRYDAVFKSC